MGRMSVIHPPTAPIEAGAIRIVDYPDRVPPMVSVHPSPASTAFLEFTDPGDGRALAESINSAMDRLEAAIVAAAGDAVDEALEDDGAATEAPERECSE
jgi:hypothetical protein